MDAVPYGQTAAARLRFPTSSRASRAHALRRTRAPSTGAAGLVPRAKSDRPPVRPTWRPPTASPALASRAKHSSPTHPTCAFQQHLLPMQRGASRDPRLALACRPEGKRSALSIRASSGCTDRTHRGRGCCRGRPYRAGLPQTWRGERSGPLGVVPQLVQTSSVVECRGRGCSRRRSGSRRVPAARPAVDCSFAPGAVTSAARIASLDHAAIRVTPMRWPLSRLCRSGCRTGAGLLPRWPRPFPNSSDRRDLWLVCSGTEWASWRLRRGFRSPNWRAGRPCCVRAKGAVWTGTLRVSESRRRTRVAGEPTLAHRIPVD